MEGRAKVKEIFVGKKHHFPLLCNLNPPQRGAGKNSGSAAGDYRANRKGFGGFGGVGGEDEKCLIKTFILN